MKATIYTKIGNAYNVYTKEIESVIHELFVFGENHHNTDAMCIEIDGRSRGYAGDACAIWDKYHI